MLFISFISFLKGLIPVYFMNKREPLFVLHLSVQVSLPETAFSANSEEHDQKLPNFAGTLMEGD